jgi:hypothetical protein
MTLPGQWSRSRGSGPLVFGVELFTLNLRRLNL